MLKIFRYLKSSMISVTIIIVLLVSQAIFDLELPDYTSKIVNIGIQQSGIENTAATVISEETYNHLLIFLSDEEQNYVNEYYDLLTPNDYNDNKNYDLLETENIYRLNTKNKKEKEKISDVLLVPFMINYMFTTGSAKEFGFAVPEGVDPYSMFTYMPHEEIDQLLLKINSNLEQMPEAMINSSAVMAVKEEYSKIGLDVSKIQTNYILIGGAKMLGISLAIMLVSIIVGLVGARLASKLAKTLREKVFEKVINFSKTEMKEYGTASLITRTTNDIQQVQQIITFLMKVVVYAPIIAIDGIIKTTSKSGSMGWIIFAAVLTLFIIMITLFSVAAPKFKKLQDLVDRLNLVTREILTGIPVIRAFSNEKHEEKRFDEANVNLNKVNLFVNRVMALMMPLMTLLMYSVCTAIVWKGAYGVDDGSMQVGDIMAYISYTMQIIMSFLMIGMLSIMLPRASVSANRIVKIIETKNSINDPEKPKMFDSKKKGIVEFKHVCFRYPDANEDVISNINFISKPGTTTAFIGSTGSGKSTLINLIPRFYDVTEGSILVDGVDIREVDSKDLRSKIGYVPQKGMLFSGNIDSNIKYGNDKISEKEVRKAADIAQASSFIEQLPGQFESEIAQGGTNVSGGQRQRISIARAIAINPDIYIFDDSFSALDFKTDASLRKELSKVTKDKTVFIVAQRISTILNADQIVVLNEGEIAGIGNHKELMETCEVYKEIALSQLSEEELKNV